MYPILLGTEMNRILMLVCFAWSTLGWCQKTLNQGKFEQLGTVLPSPNEFRSASGSPGPKYWQQKVDYAIQVTLEEKNRRIYGAERITYYNNSPDELGYLWIQLDQNVRAPESDTYKARPNNPELSLYNGDIAGVPGDSVSGRGILDMTAAYGFDGGFKIGSLTDALGEALEHTINQTMMRVELPSPLEPNESFTFQLKWWYNINDRMLVGGRSGYEFFPQDGNCLFTIAQFYPRLAVYDDINGWQNKQFLGDGEFALNFGDFDVEITVPSDHIVAATGTLANATEVLSTKQIERLEKAKAATKPVVIVSESEALKKESAPAEGTKTWKFKASNVRDFAFATSRKFIWDAMGVRISDHIPLAMSFYPKEGNPLWHQESTLAVVRTLKTYSEHTIDYPYPVAISVHTASLGMEYPMICFNLGRPNPDGSFSEGTRNSMISVIVHEVGHNFFPMIINSDERQWTWMDEGLNSFLQYLTLDHWYEDFPHRRGPPETIIPYMRGSKEFQRPVMSNSEQLIQFSANAYSKPAAALNILRETIMGRELFDYALKEYAQRWAFKGPSPADFFRTMEDASAVDLDWFWRGWFYTTDHVDLGVDQVRWLRVNSDSPKMEGEVRTNQSLGNQGSGLQNKQQGLEAFEEFYLKDTGDQDYREFLARLDGGQIRDRFGEKNFYEITFKNLGGLVMPIILEWTYNDGTTEIEKIPAEIWRYDETEVVKVFVKDKQVTKVQLDPNGETADINITNNSYPQVDEPTMFQQFKNRTN